MASEQTNRATEKGAAAHGGGEGLCQLPMSFGQQALWMRHQLEPKSPAYNIPAAFRLEGSLDVDALRQTLDSIVGRHEVLRSFFRQGKDAPVQVVSPRGSWPWSIREVMPTEATGESGDEWLQLIREEVARPFDLSAAPPIRAVLFRLGPDDHVLVLALHHIAADAWSMKLLFDEMTTLYRCFSKGEPSPLVELPVQMGDFAAWQRDRARDEPLKAKAARWKEQLRDLPGLEWPQKRLQPGHGLDSGGLEWHRFSEGMRIERAKFCRNNQVTSYTALLAAFFALLHHYTDEEDLWVGSTMAGRHHPDVESLIGFFVETPVIRVRATRTTSFGDLVQQVRRAVLEAFEQQGVSFERLIDQSRPEGLLGSAPMFRFPAVFSHEQASTSALELEGLTVRPVPLDTGTAKYPLTLMMVEGPSTLEAKLEYSHRHFDRDDARHLLRQFVVLLEAAVGEPDRRLEDLPLMTEPDRRRILIDWNQTEVPYPRDRCVHELFEEQACSRPEATAIIADKGRLTYGELDARANDLARELKAAGVHPEKCVGVCLPRSVELIVALLGILKAGGAYVPLDPSYPEERLATMAREAQLSHLVVCGSSTPSQGWMQRLKRIVVACHENPRRQEPAPAARLMENQSANSAAYLIYTSGSTGRPKGVVIPHRAVVRLVKGAGYADLGPNEVVLQYAPASFDASTFEIWGPLLNGGQLALTPAGEATLAELGDAIRRFGVTTLWLTSGLFHQMVEDRLEDLRFLRQVLAGGDALSQSHVERFLQMPNAPRLINGYGPTENTTFTCSAQLTPEILTEGTVPIGRPISNTQVFILDGQLRPVPVGVVGELYAAGDGLARGYHGSPELTAERFVPNPFDPTGGGRLYRTGDRARYRADGTILFVGRRDRQVKIRGFRIEPGEVESVLSDHPAVRQAAVVVRGEGVRKRLVAYWTPTDPSVDVSYEELRRFLSVRLPSYMVPSAGMALAALPLTGNGKLDRDALPEPDGLGGSPKDAADEPKPGLEQRVAALWQEVLKVASIGRNDNFFQLGGHSMLAMQLLARIEKEFQVVLPFRVLFERKTVADLAAAIAEARQAQPSELEPPPATPRAGDLLDRLEGLSDEEVDALLRNS